ncbi:MAG TPA: efflux RND transporter periplasmic adaptor subunit [Gemmataceae bacterium]|jgi:RND family efflux transporter MFP subunit
MNRVPAKRFVPHTLATLSAALLLAAVSGCGRSSATPESRTTPSSVPEALHVTRPQRQPLQRTIEEPGQIEAYEYTPIFSKIPGYVSEVCVDMDARVKGGDVLARLWVPELADEVREKDALVDKAKAELEQARAALKTAEAHYRTAVALESQAITERKRVQADRERWESEFTRVDALAKSRSIEWRVRDERLSQYKAAAAACEEVEAKIVSARAAREESEAQRLKAKADIEAAQAHLDVAKSQAQQAKTMLAYREVKAPYSGVITRRNVHTGHLRRSASASSGEPLFLMVRRDLVRIFVDVPEPEAPFVRQGTPVRLRIQALNDREFEAVVTRTSWALDPASRTLRTEIEVKNPNDELRPGMYAYAIITAEHANTFTLPAEALLRQDDTFYCWEYRDGKAVQTLVRPGLRMKDRVEVLKKRLPGPSGRWQDFTGSEQVLLGGIAALADGQEVSLAAAN